MRNYSMIRTSLIAIALVLAFATVPLSQTMAQDAGAMQKSSDNRTVPDKAADAWITTKVKSEFGDRQGRVGHRHLGEHQRWRGHAQRYGAERARENEGHSRRQEDQGRQERRRSRPERRGDSAGRTVAEHERSLIRTTGNPPRKLKKGACGPLFHG